VRVRRKRIASSGHPRSHGKEKLRRKPHVGYLAAHSAVAAYFREMGEIEQLGALDAPDCTPESICTSVANVFAVRKTEVALLAVCGSLLKFLYPGELRTTGVIPLSSSAVAACPARTRRAEFFNSFTRVKHLSVFEVVRLGGTGVDAEVIQKLMSAPVFSPTEEVVGVIQVSRKGLSANAAGRDFTADDLRKLNSIAITVGKVLARTRELANTV